MKEPFFIQVLFAVYRLLWLVATPFLLCFPRLKEGRAERLLKEVNFGRVDIWIHAASVGEAFIARQLVESFHENQAFDILITTNTAQGRQILEKKISDTKHNISIAYMMFDNPSLVKRAVKIADPKLLVLIELEIWPALMAEMKRTGKKMIIVNGRMTEKSFAGYNKAGFLWRMLKPDTILAISNENKKRLQTLFQQPETFYVSNIKFDRIEKCHISENTNNRHKRLVLASIRKEEETEALYIITEILKIFPDLQIDIFPRHLHRVRHWEQLLSEKNLVYALKTTTPKTHSPSVLIWDVFGELINAYQQADAVFIGGSLAPLGGQNFIEAFMNGVIPVTGPWISNFLWAGEEVFKEGLVKKGNTKEEVVQLLVNLLQNPPDKTITQKKADKYIRGKQGGSRKTCQHIVALLEQYKNEETHSEIDHNQNI